MKVLLFITCVLISTKLPSHKPVQISKISVECINGGTKGFNYTNLKCDEVKGVYYLKCQDSGFEKAQLCSTVYADNEINEILSGIQEKIYRNKPLEESYLSGHYKIF